MGAMKQAAEDRRERMAGTARGLGLRHVACTRCTVDYVVPGTFAGTEHGSCGGTLQEVGA